LPRGLPHIKVAGCRKAQDCATLYAESQGGRLFRVVWILALSTGLYAQVKISGRVVDETGAAVAGARVELRADADAPPLAASSDTAGNFQLQAPAATAYEIRAERLGFYLYRGRVATLEAGSSELLITLNHLQEFSDHVDVAYSP